MKYGMRNAGCGMRDARFKLVAFVIFFTGGAFAQEPGMEISGFRVPDYDEQGVMTSQLFGDRAEMESDGMVKITGVNMEFYKDKEVYMTVTSPHCFFDQKTRVAHSEAPIAADMEGILVRGRGFKLNSTDRKVKIFNESKVVVEDVMEQGVGSAPVENADTNDVTVITSKELYLDYNGRTVRFEGTVHVQDPQMTMDCGTMTVRFDENNEIDRIEAKIDVVLENGVTVVTSQELYFDYSGRTVRFEKTVHVKDPQMTMDCGTMNMRFNENNEINWIEALTEVKLYNEGREAQAKRAVYDSTTDEFLLEGEPRVVDGQNILLGERIRFWRATGRMVCEPSAHLIMYPDDESEFELFEK